MPLECWGQEAFDPFVHLPSEDWVCVYWQPEILPIAPHMVSQTDGHRWGTPRTTLSQTFMGHHEVVETDHETEPSPVANPAPGQTPDVVPQGCDQPPQGVIPSFHEGRLDCRAELAQA